MAGKLQSTVPLASGSCRLPAYAALHLHGRDALEFFQRQCMNDLRELDTAGCWQFNGLLGAKGRVQALFVALRNGDESLWLITPDGDVDLLAERLRAVRFRSQLQVEPLALESMGTNNSRDWPGHRNIACREGAGWALAFGSPGRERRLTVVPAGSTAPVDDGAATLSADQWWAENLRHGLPRLATTQRDRYTPQMLGLHRLGAFSVKKGCYPGQEIVARTHFLGQARRGLVRLAAARPLLAEEHVNCGSNRTELVDYAADGSEHTGVAVLPLDSGASVCQLDDGAEAIPLPFIDGLDRRRE